MLTPWRVLGCFVLPVLSSLGTSAALSLAFEADDGGPGTPIVVDDEVQDSFRFDMYELGLHVIPAQDHQLDLLWTGGCATLCSVSIGMVSGNASLLPSIQSLSIVAPSVDTQLVIGPLDCMAVGVTTLALVLRVTHYAGDGSGSTRSVDMIIKMTKQCLPRNCTGLCVRGYCAPSGCVCDAGYDHNVLCSLGLFVTPNQVCPGQEFNITLDLIGPQIYGPQISDVISLVRPGKDPTVRWTVASVNALNQRPDDDFLYQWWDIDLQSEDSRSHLQRVTTSAIHDETLPGFFGVNLHLDDFAVAASVSIQVLPKSDSQCQRPAECIHGSKEVRTDGVICKCHDGFFGHQCQHGCSPITRYTDFASVITSSVSGEPHYLNLAKCAFAIEPQIDEDDSAPVTSIVLHLSVFLPPMDADFLRIYRGLVEDENMLEAVFSGQQSSTLEVLGPSLLLVFTTDSNNPSRSQSDHHGFVAMYQAKGCPTTYGLNVTHPLQHVQFGSHLIQQVDSTASCVPCAAGSSSTLPDSEECFPCPPQTFSPRPSSTCQECPALTYSSLGSRACVPCVQGSPVPCPIRPTNPQWVVYSLLSLTGMGCLLVVAVGTMLMYAREWPTIRAGSVTFSMLLLLGLLLLLLSVPFALLQPSRDVCGLQLWLQCLGFSLTFGSLVIKSYRLFLIFRGLHVKRFRLKDWYLLRLLGAILLVDVITILAMSIISPFNVDPYTFACVSRHSDVFQYIIGGIKLLLLVVGLYMTIRVRNIPSVYNESMHQAVTQSHALLVMFVTFGVMWTQSPRYFSVVVGAVTLYIALVTLGMMYVPKLCRALELRDIVMGAQQTRQSDHQSMSSRSIFTRSSCSGSKGHNNRAMGLQFQVLLKQKKVLSKLMGKAAAEIKELDTQLMGLRLQLDEFDESVSVPNSFNSEAEDIFAESQLDRIKQGVNTSQLGHTPIEPLDPVLARGPDSGTLSRSAILARLNTQQRNVFSSGDKDSDSSDSVKRKHRRSRTTRSGVSPTKHWATQPASLDMCGRSLRPNTTNINHILSLNRLGDVSDTSSIGSGPLSNTSGSRRPRSLTRRRGNRRSHSTGRLGREAAAFLTRTGSLPFIADQTDPNPVVVHTAAPVPDPFSVTRTASSCTSRASSNASYGSRPSPLRMPVTPVMSSLFPGRRASVGAPVVHMLDADEPQFSSCPGTPATRSVRSRARSGADRLAKYLSKSSRTHSSKGRACMRPTSASGRSSRPASPRWSGSSASSARASPKAKESPPSANTAQRDDEPGVSKDINDDNPNFNPKTHAQFLAGYQPKFDL